MSNHDHKPTTTLDLIKRYIASKIPQTKQPIVDPNKSLVSPDPNFEINHIAVVLDGKVEEVIRAQNRLAALLLSQPTFIEFDPKETTISLGETAVIEGLFFTPNLKNTVEEAS